MRGSTVFFVPRNNDGQGISKNTHNGEQRQRNVGKVNHAHTWPDVETLWACPVVFW